MNLSINWKKLPHKTLNKKEIAFKSINVLSCLETGGELAQKRIKIEDSGLSLVLEGEVDNEIIQLLKEYLSESDLLPINCHFLFNHFSQPRQQVWAFELDERASVFCVATQVLTSGVCFFLGAFHYNTSENPPHYFSPFVAKEEFFSHMMEDRAISRIDTIEKFNFLNKIYVQLDKLKIFKYDERFSRLLNAVRFYSRIQSEPWFLQKIMFSFIALESIFTDTSRAEISYKVSVRTSFFLFPEDAEARRKTFRLLKVAYALRSCFLHGTKVDEAKLTRQLQELTGNKEYSLSFDLPYDLKIILSQVLSKILLNQDLLDFFAGKYNENKEEAFFNELVLGKVI